MSIVGQYGTLHVTTMQTGGASLRLHVLNDGLDNQGIRDVGQLRHRGARTSLAAQAASLWK